MLSPRQVTHLQCRLMGYFTSPDIDTRQKGPTAFSVSSERHRDKQSLSCDVDMCIRIYLTISLL